MTYAGIKDAYPNLNCVLPIKKKNSGRGKRGVKGSKLSADQKSFKKKLTTEGVIVEHTKSKLKKFRVFGAEFRNHPKRYNLVTDIV